MTQTCSKCSRANPPEAVYCYFDGFVLEGHSRNGGPVAVGSEIFNSPFVFAGGRSCRSFDELSLACQEEWAGAGEMLQQGFFETFFKTIGRVDLVVAAREAAKFPDRDRGLDQLLASFPGDVLEAPKLRLDPQEVNLGALNVGEERTFELHLDNRGMRLLYGTVTCSEGVWLALGDPPGAAQKHFQFNHELIIPVHVRGDRLRASSKPVEARLLVESNGGTQAVSVRCEVPVKPIPDGVLAGARSPRQVAEKAKAHPKEAALLFENGAVENWYKTNGWSYPVQGPVASGLGAVQQFFEALGLTPAPKVGISRKELFFKAEPGQTLHESLEVKSEEKRAVYAHGTSNQPWLEVGRAKLNGRVATIHVAIPAVPNKPGETLKARLSVQSNGNQRFQVPVTLEIEGKPFDFNASAPPVDEVVPVDEVRPVDEVAPIDEVVPMETVAAAPAATVELVPPAALVPPPSTVATAVGRRTRGSSKALPLWAHAVPAGLLALVLLGVAVWDLMDPVKGKTSGNSAVPGAKGEISWTYTLRDSEPRIGVNFDEGEPGNENMRFGIVMLNEQDPKNPDKKKRLTYQENGSSNNTCIKVDGSEHLFGKRPGQFARGQRKEALKPPRSGYRSTWFLPNDKIYLTQHVEIVPSEQSQVLDTCLVYYTVEYKAESTAQPHKVGLRIMLDTFIGANDGVPFVIPGQPGLLTTYRDFSEKQIPDYLEALERPDLKDPGTVAHMGLRGLHLPGVDLEPIHRMLICRWPSSSLRWEPDEIQSMQPKTKDEAPDSCVLLYWDYRPMQPGEKREMGFTYGLGKISIEGGEGQKLGLTAGGSLRPGGEFTVTAYVKEPKKGQKVKLILPPDLSLVKGQTAEQVVDAVAGQDYNQVSWRVRAPDKTGEYNLAAESDGSRASYSVKITAKGIFD